MSHYEASHVACLQRIASTSLLAEEVVSADREPPDLSPLLRTMRTVVFADPEVQRYIAKPTLNCYNAACRVIGLLKDRGASPQPVAMLTWASALDNSPENHFAVRVRHDEVDWVIDPTSAQFGVEPGVRPFDLWRDELVGTMPGRVVACRVFGSMSEAYREYGPYVFCYPNQHAEYLVNRPGWYKRVESSPQAFDDLCNKFAPRKVATVANAQHQSPRSRALALLRPLIPCLPKT